MRKYPVKSLVLSSLAALLLAALQSSLFMTSFVICLTPIAIAALYAWSGLLPALILSAGTVLSLGSYASVVSQVLEISISPVLAGVSALVVLVLPGAVCIAAMEKKLPFFLRMAACIGAQSAALLLFAGVMYLGFGVDLVDALTALLRSSMDFMTVEEVSLILETLAAGGMLTKESIEELSSGFVLPSDIRGALDQAFEYINYYMKQIMPAMMIHSGVLTGIVMTSVSGAIAVRKEAGAQEEDEEADEEADEEEMESSEERPLEHVPLAKWQVPRRALGMMLAGLATGIALQMSQMEAAVAVTAVFSLMLTSLLSIQGLAALSRMFLRAGASRGMRIGILTAAAIFSMQLLEIVGALSALLGSHGVISQWMKKRMEESRKDDEE